MVFQAVFHSKKSSKQHAKDYHEKSKLNLRFPWYDYFHLYFLDKHAQLKHFQMGKVYLQINFTPTYYMKIEKTIQVRY